MSGAASFRTIFCKPTGLAPGDRLLDCTLGFASEASLAALSVGESGRVVGLESVPELATGHAAQGLQTFPLASRRTCKPPCAAFRW